MIFGHYFDCDNDDALQSQQFDLYGKALGVIAYGSLEHYKNAAIIRGEYDFNLMERIACLRGDGFDHRTLQSAHDFLAAWWRWKNNRQEPYFKSMEPVTADDWLLWLRSEVDTWPEHAPDVVRLIVKVLMNQNTDTGYEAEDALQKTLKNHYSGMPKIEKSTPLAQEDNALGKKADLNFLGIFDRRFWEKEETPEQKAVAELPWVRRQLAYIKADIERSKEESAIKKRERQRNKEIMDKLNPKEPGLIGAMNYFSETNPLLKNSLIIILCLGGVLFLGLFLKKIFTVLGWKQYIPNLEDEFTGGITSTAIIIASILAVLNIYILIFTRKEYHERNGLNKLIGLPEVSLAKEVRPLWLSLLGVLTYAGIAATIDTFSRNSLYLEYGSLALKGFLLVLYAIPALIIFLLLARTWLSAFFKKQQ